MAVNLVNYEDKARHAVMAFWSSRAEATARQAESGKHDQGERSGVTSGKNMDGFVQLAVDVIVGNGFALADVMLNRRVLALPGFFRPTKLWDLLVVRNGRLIAALEFKSQVGPSFGNNANNRAEEALGIALDMQTAYREGAFGDIPKPFIGYFFLLEDAPESRVPVRDPSPHFPVFPEFAGVSYAQRYDLLCRKLMQENLYSAATVVLSPRSGAGTGEYSEMNPFTGLRTFVTSLAGYVAGAAER